MNKKRLMPEEKNRNNFISTVCSQVNFIAGQISGTDPFDKDLFFHCILLNEYFNLT
jgi:hypothetical protein